MKIQFSRVVTGIVALAVALGFLAGTAAPASAAGCTTKFGTYSTVKAGSKGSKARAVECLLHQDGYRTSRNASFSEGDAAKLKQFQRKHAIKATGRTNAATWAALVARGSRPALATGAQSSSVRRLQLALRALGHKELSGTATYGSRTKAAVKDFQASRGLPVTGRVSKADWTSLQDGGRKVQAVKKVVKVTSSAKKSSTTKGEKALAFAKKQLGESYRYGGAGPSRWDCSGLTMRAWAAAGKKLPHSAAGQYKKGKKIKKSQLRKGDLVFFYSGPSHVAIYAGGGKVVHAPRPGSKVSYIAMKYMPFKGARRPG